MYKCVPEASNIGWHIERIFHLNKKTGSCQELTFLPALLFLGLGYFNRCRYDRIRNQRNRINAGSDQKLGEIRKIGRSLPANADLPLVFMGRSNYLPDQAFNRFVLLVVDVGNQFRIPVHA